MEYPSHSDTGIELPIRPKGIAFDLDGTLLDYDGHLRETVAKSIRLITRAGTRVFLITGRLQSGAEEYWRELGLDTPIAACNGAYVGFPGEEPFLHVRLSEKARDTIIEVADRHHLYTQHYIDNSVYADHDGPEREFYARSYSPVSLLPAREDLLARRLPTKILCITPESDLMAVCELFREALGDEAVVTNSTSRFIELIPPNANKALGLRTLSKWADTPIESFIAVGDAMNDLPMLEIAGFAITFKSGDPRLFEHVDMLLPPLWEDGMDILAKCVLGMTNSGRFLTPRSQRFFKK